MSKLHRKSFHKVAHTFSVEMLTPWLGIQVQQIPVFRLERLLHFDSVLGATALQLLVHGAYSLRVACGSRSFRFRTSSGENLAGIEDRTAKFRKNVVAVFVFCLPFCYSVSFDISIPDRSVAVPGARPDGWSSQGATEAASTRLANARSTRAGRGKVEGCLRSKEAVFV